VVGTNEQPSEGLEEVLDYLKNARAFDFTGYKRGTLARRIEKRMETIDCESYEDYVDYLQVHPEEFEPLFNTILINLTSFFRDGDTWNAINDTIIPQLVARDDEQIRVWSAGCATGQEAFSAVMLLTEALGIDEAKERVKVYATDVDNEALEQARRAVYTSRELESIPEDLRAKYFDARPNGGGAFTNDLRRLVIFGRHDLLQDAPIPRVQMLMCRNTLMYFNADVQRRLVQRLQFSLVNGGFLVLGKAEMLLGHGDSFQPVDLKQRIFCKHSEPTMSTRLLTLASRPDTPYEHSVTPLSDIAFEHAPSSDVLIDAAGNLLAANAAARRRFSISPHSLGRPFQDLELSYRPVELRSSIDQARLHRRQIELESVAHRLGPDDTRFLDVRVTPLEIENSDVGVLLSFTDVTNHRRVTEELEETHRELETAYEELQSSNEELETTNEELQSTIEELETTNEELQSTNEELETMNEELSSTNEELQTINDELRDRTGDLNQVNAYMESMLTSLGASVIVLDSDLQVRVWNGLSFEMWGLRAEEVEGRGFFGLDIGFPVEVLGAAVRSCLAGECPENPITSEATNRRGQRITCRVRLSQLMGGGGAIEGIIVLIEDEATRV
jgi:two-component system CheB/CheR fusion protein